MERNGTLYGIFDSGGVCRYIGVTGRKLKYREREHARAAEKGVQTPIARAIRKWGGVSLTALVENVSISELAALEERTIQLFRSVGQADLNLLSGGYREGEYLSYRKSPDQKKRQSEITRANWSDPQWAERQRARVREALQSPEYRQGARDRALKMVEQGLFGTSRKGSLAGNVKLVEEDVVLIREKYSAGRATQKELGNMYGVTESCIHRIVHRKSWTHV